MIELIGRLIASLRPLWSIWPEIQNIIKYRLLHIDIARVKQEEKANTCIIIAKKRTKYGRKERLDKGEKFQTNL